MVSMTYKVQNVKVLNNHVRPPELRKMGSQPDNALRLLQVARDDFDLTDPRSEEHTSELPVTQ